MHKQPERKPIRRMARTPQKEKQISDRKFGNLINIFQSKVAKIDGIPKPKSKLRAHLWELEQKDRDPNEHSVLKIFLENKGMGQEWRSKLSDYG